MRYVAASSADIYFSIIPFQTNCIEIFKIGMSSEVRSWLIGWQHTNFNMDHVFLNWSTHLCHTSNTYKIRRDNLQGP